MRPYFYCHTCYHPHDQEDEVLVVPHLCWACYAGRECQGPSNEHQLVFTSELEWPD
jgi:hypothetical protein